MTLDDVTGLLEQNQVVVFTTYRRDGRPQMSMVTVGRVGDARVVGAHNSDPETVRLTLRDVYRAAARKEHPDWDEYDRVLLAEGRAAILLAPSRMYGNGV